MKAQKIDWDYNLQIAKDIANGSRLKTNITKWYNEGLDFDGWVIVRTEDREMVIETIARTIKKMETRYIVEMSVPVYNYPSEPDDIEEVEVGSYGNLADAVKHALLTVIENEINHVIQAIYMEKEMNELK